MNSVGAFEAKTHLSALLERVAKGETIQITKKGQPVALLVPPGTGGRADLRKVADEIREIRKSNRLGRVTLRKLVNDGRRF